MRKKVFTSLLILLLVITSVLNTDVIRAYADEDGSPIESPEGGEPEGGEDNEEPDGGDSLEDIGGTPAVTYYSVVIDWADSVVIAEDLSSATAYYDETQTRVVAISGSALTYDAESKILTGTNSVFGFAALTSNADESIFYYPGSGEFLEYTEPFVVSEPNGTVVEVSFNVNGEDDSGSDYGMVLLDGAGPEDINESKYTADGRGGLNYDIPAGTYGTITVPGGYNLTITGAVVADEIVIGTDAIVHIFNTDESNGSLSVNTLTRSSDAKLELGNNTNIPKVDGAKINVYDDRNLEVSINEDPEWGWFTFSWVEKDEENNAVEKWLFHEDTNPEVIIKYDDWGGRASVRTKIGAETEYTDREWGYKQRIPVGDTINIQFSQPPSEDNPDENQGIYVVVNGTKPEAPLTGTTWSYTVAETDECLDINIFWSKEAMDFGVVNPHDGEFQIEYAVIGPGYVDRTKSTGGTVYTASYGPNGKLGYSLSVNSVTLAFSPESGCLFKQLRIEGDESGPIEFDPEHPDPFVSQQDGTIKYTIDTSGLRSYDTLFVEIEFMDDGSGGGNQDSSNWPRLADEMAEVRLAFGDINKDNTTDTADIKWGFTRYLVDTMSSIYLPECAQMGYKPDLEGDSFVYTTMLNDFLPMVTVTETPLQETLNVVDKNNNSHALICYEVQFSPLDSDDAPIALTKDIKAKVYLIKWDELSNSREQVIFKVGTNYYIRDGYSSGPSNNDDAVQFPGLNSRAIMIVSNYSSVSDIEVFGNLVTSGEAYSDVSAANYYAASYGPNGFNDIDAIACRGKYVICKPNFVGVTINGINEGGSKKALAWSEESSLSIAETSGNSSVEVFYGYPAVEIAAVSSEDVSGLSVSTITNVEILGGIPTNAVSVEGPVESTSNAEFQVYKIKFYSDYYDSVGVRVTYDDVITKTFTINRVGISIDGGAGAGSGYHTIRHGHDAGKILDLKNAGAIVQNQTAREDGHGTGYIVATYYYPEGTATGSSTVSLFVTITNADGSIERRIIPSTIYTPESSSSVAMSDYVIYVGDTNGPTKIEAIAVPNASTTDGKTRFVGAKLGSGKGVTKNITYRQNND